ncbi:MAG: AbrB family transcriptional regulator [Planctomycetota bacterium]|jgi:membrane AbrB-like protein|nr:AbrB family transcriptional regulator [Planctomycetota bacterium]
MRLVPPDLSGLPVQLRWPLLAALTLAFAHALVSLRLPAGILMGAMGAAILLAVSGARVGMPKTLFSLAQGMVGCLVASSISSDTLGSIARSWPFFLSMVLGVSGISAVIGWLLARAGAMPAATAIWGTSPGAALLMTVMSGDFGADSQLVAFMQYLRVLVVTISATTLPLLLGAEAAAAPVRADAGFDLPSVAWALGLGAAGTFLGRRLNFSAGPMLFPILALPLLTAAGLARVRLPWQLFAVSYCLVGWSVGMRFTRDIIAHALRLFSRILASIVAMILACGLLAWLFVLAGGVDPLTAFLASCPGGMDSVAIIAASVGGDVPLVMAVQTGRFIFVLFTGPALAAFLTRRLKRRLAAGDAGEWKKPR